MLTVKRKFFEDWPDVSNIPERCLLFVCWFVGYLSVVIDQCSHVYATWHGQGMYRETQGRTALVRMFSTPPCDPLHLVSPYFIFLGANRTECCFSFAYTELFWVTSWATCQDFKMQVFLGLFLHVFLCLRNRVHGLYTTPLILQVLSSLLQQASLTCHLISLALWSPSSLQEDRLQSKVVKLLPGLLSGLRLNPH